MNGQSVLYMLYDESQPVFRNYEEGMLSMRDAHVTKEQVVNCYRYILGREPENVSAVEEKMQSFQNLEEMRKDFLESYEFRCNWSITPKKK